MGKHLIDHIDKGLSVIPREALNHFSFMTVREDDCDQGDTLIRGEGTNNQPLPRWNVTTHEGQANTRMVPELRLTSRVKFPTLLDVGGLLDPSIVASMPKTHLSKSGWSAVAGAHHP